MSDIIAVSTDAVSDEIAASSGELIGTRDGSPIDDENHIPEPPGCPCRLLPHHLADLQASGLTDETIQAAGLYSETDFARLTRILGWNVPRKMSPSLVFPYFTIDGANGYCRVKPDDPRTCQGKPVKYESPKGRSNQVYLPPGSRCRLDDGQEMLLVTEGEKKSLALDQAGFVIVGLVGRLGLESGPATAAVARTGNAVLAGPRGPDRLR